MSLKRNEYLVIVCSFSGSNVKHLTYQVYTTTLGFSEDVLFKGGVTRVGEVSVGELRTKVERGWIGTIAIQDEQPSLRTRY